MAGGGVSWVWGFLFEGLLVRTTKGYARLAKDWIGLFNTKLKALDAVHLAIASAEGLRLVTADQDLHDSAKALAQEVLLLKPSK